MPRMPETLGSSPFSVKIEDEGFSTGLAIPTGLKLLAQGCEERATLGKNPKKPRPCKGCI
jgi:hypothetical protein